MQFTAKVRKANPPEDYPLEITIDHDVAKQLGLDNGDRVLADVEKLGDD